MILTKKIIKSKIDANKNIETEYKFKNWQYTTNNINLTENEKFFSTSWDTKVEITFLNIKFFFENIKNIFIRTIITFITKRDFNV